MDSVRLCNDVDSSSQGRSWNAGGKGGRRGAPLVGNQDSSPESDKPSRLADKDSSMGKSGKWWWDVGGGDQQLSILPNKQTNTSQTLAFSCFVILSRASRAPCCLISWMALTGTSATTAVNLHQPVQRRLLRATSVLSATQLAFTEAGSN